MRFSVLRYLFVLFIGTIWVIRTVVYTVDYIIIIVSLFFNFRYILQNLVINTLKAKLVWKLMVTTSLCLFIEKWLKWVKVWSFCLIKSYTHKIQRGSSNYLLCLGIKVTCWKSNPICLYVHLQRPQHVLEKAFFVIV